MLFGDSLASSSGRASKGGVYGGDGAVKANGVPAITTNATTFPVRTPLEPHAYRGLDSSALNLRLGPTYSVSASAVSSSGGRPTGGRSTSTGP